MTNKPRTWVELRVLRTKDGYSLSELHRQSGISLSYLSQLESGQRQPTPKILRLLADTLHVPMSMLEPRAGEEVA